MGMVQPGKPGKTEIVALLAKKSKLHLRGETEGQKKKINRFQGV